MTAGDPATAVQLGRSALQAAAARGVAVPSYDISAVVPSVVHIGPGVFHRGHQAVYADDVLGSGSPTGGIIAVALRSSELRDALAAQDSLYTLLERDNAGDRVRVIGSIREALVARDDPQAVLARLADPAVSVVTITVTEKGYCAVGSTGALDSSRTEVQHDIADPSSPESLPGFLVEALVRRRAAGVAPLTILSCDNLRSNGQATRRVVVELAEHRGGDLADWIGGNVSFPSSMVDRMVPATTDAERALVRDLAGLRDAWPVVTERFSQWVVEDVFPHGRPPWEKVGAELVSDVEPFEQAKLRILNGAHSAFAYWGLLAGHGEITEAVADPALRAAVEEMLRSEVIPTLDAPPGMDLAAYADEVLARFANHTLGYTTAKVAGDGSQKLPVRVLGTVCDRLAAGAGVERLALVIAAYLACVFGPRSVDIVVVDPALERLLGKPPAPLPDSNSAVDLLLALTDVVGDLAAATPFTSAVRRHAAGLWSGDIRNVLAGLPT